MKVKIVEQPKGPISPIDYHRPYEEIQCVCGSQDFKVFQGSYVTIVKCSKCEEECTIHEG